LPKEIKEYKPNLKVYNNDIGGYHFYVFDNNSDWTLESTYEFTTKYLDLLPPYNFNPVVIKC